MKKKIFLTIAIIIMFSVIVMAYLKKNNIIDTNSIKNSFKNTTTVNKNNKSTMKNVGDNNVKELEDIPVYKIGEEAHCGALDSNDENKIINFDAIVEDVEISDKVGYIPEGFTDDELRFVNKDGYPIDIFKDYKFLNIKIKLINKTDSVISVCLNSTNIIKAGKKYEYLDSEVVCYDEFDRYFQKNYFEKKLGAYEEFETVLSIAVKDENIDDNLMLLISQSGALNYYDGAVLIDLNKK